MSIKTNYRYRQIHLTRFRALLGAWLGTLPAGGWAGSVDELNAELERVNAAGRHFAFVPTSSGLSKAIGTAAATVAGAGWRVEFTRTAKARTIVFTRVGPARGRAQVGRGVP